MIENLPLLHPDPVRAERLRARCRDRLGRQRHAERPQPRQRPAWRPRRWEPAMVGGVCLIYLSAVVMTAFQVLGGE